MWKKPSEEDSSQWRQQVAQGKTTTAVTSDSTPESSSESLPDIAKTLRVKVRIIRPDGTSRDTAVAGHFREEHLCSLIDNELCQLETGETLIVHLYEPDSELTQSLRDRWREGMSDNRQVFVREVLGPNDDPHQLSAQLRQIRHRLAAGEKINLAIRSPKIARAASKYIRKLLLVSQQSDDNLLSVWVHGNESQQRSILKRLAEAGVVLRDDYERFATQHRERRWKGPWIDFPIKPVAKKPKKPAHKVVSPQEAVSRWIKKVEEDREHQR